MGNSRKSSRIDGRWGTWGEEEKGEMGGDIGGVG